MHTNCEYLYNICHSQINFFFFFSQQEKILDPYISFQDQEPKQTHTHITYQPTCPFENLAYQFQSKRSVNIYDRSHRSLVIGVFKKLINFKTDAF